MSLFGESKVEYGPSRSPKSCQANSTGRHKRKQNQTTKTKTHNTQRRERWQRHSNGSSSLCANEFRDLTQKQQKHTRPQSKILRRCQTKHPLSSAETRDPPCQDPGDRAEKPSGHETSSQWKQCSELESNTSVGTLPWEAPRTDYKEVKQRTRWNWDETARPRSLPLSKVNPNYRTLGNTPEVMKVSSWHCSPWNGYAVYSSTVVGHQLVLVWNIRQGFLQLTYL